MPPSHCSWKWRQALLQGGEASPGSVLGHCPVLWGLSWRLCAVAEGAGVGWAPGRTLPSMLYAWPRESPRIISVLRLGCRFKGRSSTPRGEYDEGTRARGGDGWRCDPGVCKTRPGHPASGPSCCPSEPGWKSLVLPEDEPSTTERRFIIYVGKGGSEISKWENGIEKIMSRSSRRASACAAGAMGRGPGYSTCTIRGVM